MYGSAFNYPGIPKRYIPIWIRPNPSISLCNVLIELSITYYVRQTTVVPVTEDVIDFWWELVEGTEPLEFTNRNKATATILIDPSDSMDKTFRVYIDKGKPTEISTLVKLYRTPTDEVVIGAVNTEVPIEHTLATKNGLLKTKTRYTGLLPSLTVDKYLIVENDWEYDVDTPYDYKLTFERNPDFKYEVLNSELYKQDGTPLYAGIGEVSEVIVPKGDYRVYYKIWFDVNGQRELLCPNLYLFLGLSDASTVEMGRYDVTKLAGVNIENFSKVSKLTAYPQVLNFSDISKLTTKSASISKVDSLVLTPNVLTTSDDVTKLFTLTVESLTTKEVKRFDDINIGG